MAFEHINKLDSLNKGRVKLNRAIDGASEAKEDAVRSLARSLSAEQIAQLAQLKSDDTQQQLDNIIIESGTSDAEVIQARGNEPLLKDRLNKTDQQLADIAINVRNYVTNYADARSGIQEAEDVAFTLKKPLFFPKGYEFNVLDTVNIREGIDVIMHSSIVYAAEDNKPALVIGTKGIVNYAKELLLNVKRKNVSSWTDENSIGIQLINCNNTQITIAQARGFTKGAEALGSGQGFTYCQVFLGDLINNKIGLDVVNESYEGKIGWSNETTYHGGRFSCLSNIGVGLNRIGVRITSKDSTNLFNNNNTFYAPNFELNQAQAGAAEALPILIERGGSNRFYDYRDEGNGPFTARVTGSSRHNLFSVGFNDSNKVPRVDDRTPYPSSYVENTKEAILYRGFARQIFTSGKLIETSNIYDVAAGNIFIPKVNVGNTTNSTVYKTRTDVKISDGSVESAGTSGIGVFIDTNQVKQFILNKDTVPGYQGVTYIICYDENGQIIPEATEPLVKTNSSEHPVTYDSVNLSFGGGYRNAANLNDIKYFQVVDKVKKIRLLIARKSVTEPLRLKSFSVTAIGHGEVTVSSGLEEIIDPNKAYAVNPPLTGARGKKIYNDAPVAGGYDAWVYVGTSGTRKGVGLIES